MNRETVIITRRTANGTDAYGNDTYSTTNITIQALVADNHSKMVTEASREPYDALCTLYVTKALEVLPTDLFSVRGVEWLFHGLEQWVSPFPSPDGLVIHLRRRSG